MTGLISRRSVLGQLSAATTLAALAPRLGRAADAPAADSVVCLSMIYGAKSKFNSDRFRDKHLPLLRSVYGDSIERVELRAAPHQPFANAGSSVAAPPPVLIPATVHIWIRDLKAFGEATAKSGPDIVADLAKVTDAHPIVQYDEVIAARGVGRGEIALRTECVTLLYPNKEGAHWDAKQYVDVYLPKMLDAYGTAALRRVEVSRGSAGQGGARPGYISAVAMYIGDRAAYDAAGFKAGKDLMMEAFKVTNIPPMFANLQVKAAG